MTGEQFFILIAVIVVIAVALRYLSWVIFFGSVYYGHHMYLYELAQGETHERALFTWVFVVAMGGLIILWLKESGNKRHSSGGTTKSDIAYQACGCTRGLVKDSYGMLVPCNRCGGTGKIPYV